MTARRIELSRFDLSGERIPAAALAGGAWRDLRPQRETPRSTAGAAEPGQAIATGNEGPKPGDRAFDIAPKTAAARSDANEGQPAPEEMLAVSDTDDDAASALSSDSDQPAEPDPSERLVEALEAGTARFAELHARALEDASRRMIAAARRLFPRLTARNLPALMAEAVREAIASGERPSLVLKLHPDLELAARAALAAAELDPPPAIEADPTLTAGSACLEWQDGAAVIDPDRIAAAALAELGDTASPSPTDPESFP